MTHFENWWNSNDWCGTTNLSVRRIAQEAWDAALDVALEVLEAEETDE